MSTQETTSISLHSNEVPLNVFSYILQALKHYSLIGVVGGYLLRNTYQRTVLGPIWLFVQCILPVAGMIAVFHHVNSFQTSAIPYPLFLISGMGLWCILDVGLKRGLRNLNYAKKYRKVVHAPRLSMTIAGLSIPLFHHMVFFMFLLGSAAFLWFKSGNFSLLIGFNLIYVLVSVLLTCMLVVGISAVLSVIFLMSRDIRHVIGALIQMWFFVTPIMYPLEILPDRLRWFSYYVNPMTSIVEMYRYGLFGGPEPQTFIVSAAITICIFLLGVWFLMRSDWILDEVL
jgi:lipopolysaccharide transport system permease protein